MNQRRNMKNKREKSRIGVEPAPTARSGSLRKRIKRAAEDDRRFDAELADTFPASDPPSIFRRDSKPA
jgi:hypothetical protein